MPVKSSHLSVIKWPNLETIRRRWLPGSKSSVVPNLPCFAPDILVPMPAGIGVGRDLDVIIIVKYAEASFMERGLAWDLTHLPVPVDLVIYNQEEWEEMVKRGDHFTRVVGAEAVWL